MKTTLLLGVAATVAATAASAISRPDTVLAALPSPSGCVKDGCPSAGKYDCKGRKGCVADLNSPDWDVFCNMSKDNCWISSRPFQDARPTLSARDTGCCFHVTASGGPGGLVGQLSDGQNRIGQDPPGLPTGEYCLNGQGGLVDSQGRGCILTPPTSQWQCDSGAKPMPGFSVAANGNISKNDTDTKFFTCPTGDHGGWNLYGETLSGEPRCEPVTLVADSCKANSPPPTAPPAVPSSQCPAELPDHYEFPHYIKPLNEAAPDVSYNNSYNGTAGVSLSSIFNFDIPQSDNGKLCNIKFLLPQQHQLETSAFTYGSGEGFKFELLSAPATETTTFNNAPKVKTDFGTFKLAPGGAYDIASITCPAGEKLSLKFSALGTSYLDFFQDYNPCPLGLYIIPK